jgi:quercetin dioxygenase-like cupin family protein
MLNTCAGSVKLRSTRRRQVLAAAESEEEQRMSESEVKQDHPMKVTVDRTPSDESLQASDGWMDMDVRWLVTSKTVGSENCVFGLTYFAPGAKHDIHRHPNAEETEYIVSGSGVAAVGDDNVRVDAGEMIFVPRNEYHGFHNDTDTEAVMVWTYAPAASLEEAGYVRREDDEAGG